MKLINITAGLAAIVASVAASPGVCQTVSNGYTVLHNYVATQDQHDIWAKAIDQNIANGYVYYENYQNVNSKGGDRLATELGSFYLYVYAPAHHEAGTHYTTPGYDCFTMSPYDPRTSIEGSQFTSCFRFDSSGAIAG